MEHTMQGLRRLIAVALLPVLVVACTSNGSDDDSASPGGSGTSTTAAASTGTDRAYYVLPPGNYGGIPTNEHSLDQLPLYDGLTPLRGDVTEADLEKLFLPMDLQPIGTTTTIDTGHPGVTIAYDEYGVAHIDGKTREDMAWGAGWVTARDRGLLLDFGRGPARAAVADVPGIDAFSLVTGAQQFVPSAATEQLVSDQVQLILDTYGDEGQQIVDEAQAYADGVTAYYEANPDGTERKPFTVEDVVATTAFIGSIFGAGGGGEAANAEFLSTLERSLGAEKGRQAWEDLLETDDPEAPTTLDERFDYGTFTGGDVVGSVPIDAGSIISLDPRQPAEGASPVVDDEVAYAAAGRPTGPAGVQLAAGGARRVGRPRHARGDGSPTGLLLPRDRDAGAPQRARHRRPGRRSARPGHVPADRTDPRLRLEPHLRQPRRARRVRRAALRARRLHAHA